MSKQELEQPFGPGGSAPAASSPQLAARVRRHKPPDPLLLERLAETGFLATEFGLHTQGERIFQCLATLKPDKPSPLIALAMVRARTGRMQEAIAALRGVIEQHPDSELARAVLGTMLVHIGDSDGAKLLEDVIARAVDSDATSVAASCIEQARVQAASTAPAAGRTSASAVELFRHYNIRA